MLSYNVNGIRAAIRKGILEWLATNDVDIICLQELKAWRDQVDISGFEDLGYEVHFCEAEKKGYSGVGILSKIKPEGITEHQGDPESLFYNEGRYLQADFKDFSIVNSYFPSGSAGEHRQKVKMEFLQKYLPRFSEVRDQKKNLLICGDFNICHKAIDIHDPVRNANVSGFRPEEREWMDNYFNSGFIDCFRQFHSEAQRYSWWSLRTRARERNRGWRIDYITASESFRDNLIDCELLEDVPFSDHCPVYLRFKL